MAVAVVCTGNPDHEYVNAPVPPEPETVASPLQNPHDVDELLIIALSGAGSVKETVLVVTQPVRSVTVTE